MLQPCAEAAPGLRHLRVRARGHTRGHTRACAKTPAGDGKVNAPPVTFASQHDHSRVLFANLPVDVQNVEITSENFRPYLPLTEAAVVDETPPTDRDGRSARCDNPPG